MIQLNNMRIKPTKDIEFIKKYPNIIHTLFGRGLSLIKYSTIHKSHLSIISELINDIVGVEVEVSEEILQSFLQVDKEHLLLEEDFEKLSTKYDIGFCIVKQGVSKKLQHDILLKINKHNIENKELPMILLYQFEDTLIHILKKETTDVRLGQLTTKMFLKELQKL